MVLLRLAYYIFEISLKNQEALYYFVSHVLLFHTILVFSTSISYKSQLVLIIGPMIISISVRLCRYIGQDFLRSIMIIISSMIFHNRSYNFSKSHDVYIYIERERTTRCVLKYFCYAFITSFYYHSMTTSL